MIGTKVFIYWNVRKRCWSVRACEGPSKGRVVLHVNNFWINNVIFKVSEAGRQRVIREHKKNVHAGVVGNLVQYTSTELTGMAPLLDKMDVLRPIRYNPYINSTFIHVVSQLPVRNATYVKGIDSGHIYAVGIGSWPVN